MNCIKCTNKIPDGRLKALPNTKICVDCSSTQKVAGHTIISGKTEYSQIQIVDQETAQHMHHLQTRKGFGILTGVKFKFDSRKN
jgi:hypothetical protein